MIHGCRTDSKLGLVLRGVIACAWPGELRLGASKLEIPVAGLPDTVAKNYDISDDNCEYRSGLRNPLAYGDLLVAVMFGAFEPSPVPEHLLSPPLIMIDLGIVTIEKCET